MDLNEANAKIRSILQAIYNEGFKQGMETGVPNKKLDKALKKGLRV